MTYLAASVGRAVVELYPKHYHKEFLSKFSRERYSMIYGQENFKKVHVQRAMEMIWAGFPVTDSGVSGEEIQTERTTSIAEAVEGSFPEGLTLR